MGTTTQRASFRIILFLLDLPNILMYKRNRCIKIACCRYFNYLNNFLTQSILQYFHLKGNSYQSALFYMEVCKHSIAVC